MKTISDHILDICQNSIRAKATLIEIMVEEDIYNDFYRVTICDNGFGMDEETARRAADPFYTSRTTRKVGLGLPLFKQNAEQAGGSFSLVSAPGEGTRVTACFKHRNIDRPPLGEIAQTLVLLVIGNEDLTFRLLYKTPSGEYNFDSAEVKEALGEVLKLKEGREAVIELINNNLIDIGATS